MSFITKKLQGFGSYSAFPLVSAGLLGAHTPCYDYKHLPAQNVFSKPFYKRILKSRLMLLWVSGITVLEATAALSYCCNSNSLGSTEMGFSNSPGGNPLKFESDSHQFPTSVWSRRTPCQPPASKARYSPWAPLPMNYTRRKWKRERESSPRAWTAFLCV